MLETQTFGENERDGEDCPKRRQVMLNRGGQLNEASCYSLHYMSKHIILILVLLKH